MVSAVRQATLRLALRAGFLEKRERLRTPVVSVDVKKTNPRYTSALKWLTRLESFIQHSFSVGKVHTTKQFLKARTGAQAVHSGVDLQLKQFAVVPSVGSFQQVQRFLVFSSLGVQCGDGIGVTVAVDTILNLLASRLEPVSIEAFPAGSCVDLFVERTTPLEQRFSEGFDVWQGRNLQALGNRLLVHALQLVSSSQPPHRPPVVGVHLQHTSKLSDGLIVASGGQQSKSGVLGNIKGQRIQFVRAPYFLESLLRLP